MFNDQQQLFTLALGLQTPWQVKEVVFSASEKQLDIHLDFKAGSKFACPHCGKEVGVYDSEERVWRHLNFFQHKAYLHAREPRVKCPDCGVCTVQVPWARPRSGFTLLFEAYILTLAQQMPVRAIARLVGEHDTRLWHMLDAYVQKARSEADYSEVANVGIDETASKRGHNYISIFADLETAKILYVTEGKGKETVVKFRQDLIEHQGKPENIKNICCDMSPSFISGVKGSFSHAALTFDKFHIVKIINEALDEVRRQERKANPWLKGTRYLWLKNPQNLTQKQEKKMQLLRGLNSITERAYGIKLSFQGLFQQPDLQSGAVYLQKWYFWATHSRLEPIKKAAKTIKEHWAGILNWSKNRRSNGMLEGINSLIQAAKAKARGYRTTKNLITMCYLIAGKLNLDFISHGA